MQSYFNTSFCANKECYNFNKLLAFIPFKPYLKRAETMPDTSEKHIWHIDEPYLARSQTISGTQSRPSPADRPEQHVSRRGSATTAIFSPFATYLLPFSPPVYCLFITCLLPFHHLFIVFSPPVYCLFTTCLLSFHYLFITFSLPICCLFAIICYNLSPVFRKIFIKKICTFRPFFLPLHPQTYLRHADKPDL